MSNNNASSATVNSQNGDGYHMTSFYEGMATAENKMVAKEMTFSRSDTHLPSSMVGATRNVQEAP